MLFASTTKQSAAAGAVVASIWTALALAVLSGNKVFSLWPQVTDLYERKAPLLWMLAREHPHFLRYLLVYPAFKLSEVLPFSADWIFSVACVGLLFSVYLLTQRVAQWMTNSLGLNVGAAAVFVALAFVMNGRGVLALFGYALVLYALASFFAKPRVQWVWLASLPVGLLFCGVSSGILVVAVAFLTIGGLYCVLRHDAAEDGIRKSMVLIVAYTLTVLPYSRFVYIGVEKNIIHFGGGIDGLWRMLTHGAGVVLTKIDPLVGLWAALPLVVLLGIGLWLAALWPPIMVLCIVGICCAAFGGVFGFATLAVGIVPLVAVTGPFLMYALRPQPAILPG